MTRIFIIAALFAMAASGTTTPTAAATSHGRAFLVNIGPASSARAAFRQAFESLGAHGLSAVQLSKAIADRSDRFVEGSFDAEDGGRAVSGVLLVNLPGAAGVAVDDRDRIAQTLPSLVRRLVKLRTPAATAPIAPLHTVSFGSGTIGLPDGWQVANSFQGCVEATSNRDHGYLAFGCPQFAISPPGLPGTNPAQQLVVPMGAPQTTLVRYLAYPLPAGLGLQAVRVREFRPVASISGGRSAYVLFDYRIGKKPFRGFALATVAPIDNMAYLFYKSLFLTPAATFPKLAPTMWRSWQSWGVNSSVFNSRLASAAQSMREAGDILTGAYWARQHANDQSALAFDQYIRDVETVENTNTGVRKELPYVTGDALVAGNPSRYRLVPTAELLAR